MNQIKLIKLNYLIMKRNLWTGPNQGCHNKNGRRDNNLEFQKQAKDMVSYWIFEVMGEEELQMTPKCLT